MSHHLLLLKFYHKYLDLYGPICPKSKTDFLFCLWAWLCLVVGVVVTVVVAVSDGRGACRWFWIVFFSEIYYFIV